MIKKFCTSRLSSVRHESEDQNGRMYSRERIRRGPTYPEPSYYKHDLEKGIPRSEVKKYTVIARKLELEDDTKAILQWFLILLQKNSFTSNSLNHLLSGMGHNCCVSYTLEYLKL